MKKYFTLSILLVISLISISQTNHVVNTIANSFNPSNLIIAVGDTVTWTNTGGMHNVNGNQSTFASNPASFGNSLGSGWTYSHVFSIPGIYDYQCDPHAGMGMVGSILVQSVLDTALILHGIIDFDLASGGATGKAIHLYASKNISDLSVYGIGVANNGGGTDGQEYTFPSMSVSQGDHILLARDTNEMSTYFDSCFSSFNVVLQATSSISQNGNDAIELFENGSIIETFGDPNVNGTGEPWEYLDSWAYKDNIGSVVFGVNNWLMGGVNCSDNSTTTLSSGCPYPLCVVAPPPPPVNTSNITFQVDMSQVLDNFNTPELNGTFNGWCGNCNPMTDSNGDEIWQVSLDLNLGDTIEYKFSADNWAIQETNDPNDFCTNGDPTYTNRVLIVPQNDTTLLDVCWGSCSPCATRLETMNSQQINFYPNPADKIINFDFEGTIDNFQIRDLSGRLILSMANELKSLSIDVSSYSQNIYIFNYIQDGKFKTRKFTVIH